MIWLADASNATRQRGVNSVCLYTNARECGSPRPAHKVLPYRRYNVLRSSTHLVKTLANHHPMHIPK